MSLSRRDFIRTLGLAAAAGMMPRSVFAARKAPADLYEVPKFGNVRLLHITDTHAQLLPVYFREPNVNLGVGDAFGRPPHLVGKKLLEAMGMPLDGREAYAYTYLDFENAAKKYGKTGGFPQMRTLLDRLRKQAGGRQNTLTLDGGDLWQGSGTSLWTRGVDMVEASNILGIDVGSVSVSAVILDPGKQILQNAYEFHQGKTAETLRQILAKFDLAAVGGIAATASTPSILKQAARYDNQVAVLSAVRHLHPAAGSILVVGG